MTRWLIKIDIEVSNGLWNNIKKSNWQKEHSGESHRIAHNFPIFEAFEIGNKPTKNNNFSEEDPHKNYFDYRGSVHLKIIIQKYRNRFH